MAAVVNNMVVHYVIHEVKGYTVSVGETVTGEWVAMTQGYEAEIVDKQWFNFEDTARECAERMAKFYRYHLSGK